MISYAYSQGITSSVRIAEFARFYMYYIYVCDGIKPSEATIRKFIREKGYLFQPMMGCSLIFCK